MTDEEKWEEWRNENAKIEKPYGGSTHKHIVWHEGVDRRKAFLDGLSEGRTEQRRLQIAYSDVLEKENAEKLAEEIICSKCLDDINRNYIHCHACHRCDDFIKGLAEGRKETTEKYSALEKENAKLKKEISVLLSCANCQENKGGYVCEKEYNDKCLAQKIEYIKELKEEITDLKAQIKKMKRCGNCKHYSFHLNVCHAHERRVWKTFEDTIACEKWEM